VLPDEPPKKLLFISAGSGVTPIMSMLRHLDREDRPTDAVLLHSARYIDEVIFGVELRGLAERREGYALHEQLTRGAGRMGPEDLDRLCPDWREREVYISGPNEMLDAFTERFKRDGDCDEPQSPLQRLTPEQIEEIGRQFDALHEQVSSDLGDRDARCIRSMIALQRRLALIGRLELIASRWRIPWALGAVTLGVAKILENMEIGHNVLHGQWDWMNDPVINPRAWDWDTASTAEAWRHSHNYVHHTYTNILGKDRDLGYEIMRIDPHQQWSPFYLLQPIYNIVLTMLFEWGVAVHDLDFEAIRKGEKSMAQVRTELKGIAGKARTQIQKDYVAWPLISGLVMTAIEAGIFTIRTRTNGGRRSPRLCLPKCRWRSTFGRH